MYLVLTCMPGESYRRRLRSLLLCLCDVFEALINSFTCCFNQGFFNANCNAVVCLCDGKVCVTSFKSYLTPSRVVLFSCFDVYCNAVLCLCGRKQSG